MRILLCVFFLLPLQPICSQTTPLNVSAYISSPRRALVAPELPEIDDYWVANSFAWVNGILASYPPSLTETPARRPALQRLDDIFHMRSAPLRPSVLSFLQKRIDMAVLQMEQNKNENELRIWKLYNAGFVVRSGDLTIGFDLIPGVPGTDCKISQEAISRLVAQVDVLFISHEHTDHASLEMAEAFVRAGKTVIAPTGLWSNLPVSKQIIYPARSADQSIPINIRNQSLAVTAYPGHQGPVLNNIYYVQFPDGESVIHTGDQDPDSDQSSDRQWLQNIGRQHHVNVLLVDCWYANVTELIAGVHPDIVLPGHEDELAHTVDHREDYAQTYERFAQSSRPYVVMTWGESLQIQRKIDDHN